MAALMGSSKRVMAHKQGQEQYMLLCKAHHNWHTNTRLETKIRRLKRQQSKEMAAMRFIFVWLQVHVKRCSLKVVLRWYAVVVEARHSRLTKDALEAVHTKCWENWSSSLSDLKKELVELQQGAALRQLVLALRPAVDAHAILVSICTWRRCLQSCRHAQDLDMHLQLSWKCSAVKMLGILLREWKLMATERALRDTLSDWHYNWGSYAFHLAREVRFLRMEIKQRRGAHDTITQAEECTPVGSKDKHFSQSSDHRIEEDIMKALNLF